MTKKGLKYRLSLIAKPGVKRALEPGMQIPGLYKRLEEGVLKEQLQLLNRAGVQRMLTQKLVKLLMMQKFGVGDRTVVSEIEQTVEEFEENLKSLREYKNNNFQIVEQLGKVAGAWERFLSSSQTKELDETLELNGLVLVEMEKAVTMYEEEFSRRKEVKA